MNTFAIVAAVAAAIGAWFAENAAIHAMGYSGFAGAGYITAAWLPLAAAGYVYSFLSELGD